jgi:hypothetical protein
MLQFSYPLPLAVSKIIDILLQFAIPLPLAVNRIIDILLQFSCPFPLAVSKIIDILLQFSCEQTRTFSTFLHLQGGLPVLFKLLTTKLCFSKATKILSIYVTCI